MDRGWLVTSAMIQWTAAEEVNMRYVCIPAPCPPHWPLLYYVLRHGGITCGNHLRKAEKSLDTVCTRLLQCPIPFILLKCLCVDYASKSFVNVTHC